MRWLPYLAFLILGGAAAVPISAWASVAGLPDAPSPVSSDAAQPAAENGHPVLERETTWSSFVPDFLHDQKDIWLFPAQLAKGNHWLPTVAIAGGTTALIYADPHVMPFFRAHQLNDEDDVFSPYITTGEVVALPVSLLAAGYARHDPYEVSTSLLAARAYADSAIVDLAIKAITRRERPSDVAPGAPFTGTFFNGGKSPLHGSAFPSGHSAGAFSVATVVAERYRNHSWVPWASYGLATAVSLSRIVTLAHYPSDVFLGAALGYTTARYQVMESR